MMLLLRKFRQVLLSGNKITSPASPAGRYLLYAIGEIVLVVIGIMIAVSLNNWNELMKQNIKSKMSPDNKLKSKVNKYQNIISNVCIV